MQEEKGEAKPIKEVTQDKRQKWIYERKAPIVQSQMKRNSLIVVIPFCSSYLTSPLLLIIQHLYLWHVQTLHVHHSLYVQTHQTASPLYVHVTYSKYPVLTVDYIFHTVLIIKTWKHLFWLFFHIYLHLPPNIIILFQIISCCIIYLITIF